MAHAERACCVDRSLPAQFSSLMTFNSRLRTVTPNPLYKSPTIGSSKSVSPLRAFGVSVQTYFLTYKIRNSSQFPASPLTTTLRIQCLYWRSAIFVGRIQSAVSEHADSQDLHLPPSFPGSWSADDGGWRTVQGRRQGEVHPEKHEPRHGEAGRGLHHRHGALRRDRQLREAGGAERCALGKVRRAVLVPGD